MGGPSPPAARQWVGGAARQHLAARRSGADRRGHSALSFRDLALERPRLPGVREKDALSHHPRGQRKADRSYGSRLPRLQSTSALGRSSIYNRLRFEDRYVFKTIGFTQGYGHFHFSDDVFNAIVQFVTRDGNQIRGHKYGDGPNWRIRTLRRGLEELGFSGNL